MTSSRGGFLVNSEGSAAVEYAVMLAMIIGSSLLLMDALGRCGAVTFSRLPAHLNGNDQIARGTSDARPTSNSNSTNESTTNVTSDSLWADARLVTTGCVLAASSLGAFMLLRGRRQRAKEASQEDNQTADDSTSEEVRYIAKRQQILRGLANDGRRVLHNELIVKQIMSPPTAHILPEMPLAELEEMMRARHIRHLLVCTAEGELRGIISDRDLHDAVGRTAADIMTSHPIIVAPDAMLSHAVTVMLERRISALPVVSDGQLAGIVTMTDVAMALQCTLQLVDRLVREVEHAVGGHNLDGNSYAMLESSRSMAPAAEEAQGLAS